MRTNEELLFQLDNYNTPDRTNDDQRQIAVDIHDAKARIESLLAERSRWLDWLVQLRKMGRLSGMNTLLDEMNAVSGTQEYGLHDCGGCGSPDCPACYPADSRQPPLPENQDSYYPCKRAMLQEQPYSECFPTENCLGCDCWRAAEDKQPDVSVMANQNAHMQAEFEADRDCIHPATTIAGGYEQCDVCRLSWVDGSADEKGQKP